MKKNGAPYYKGITALLWGLKTVTPISNNFHIHQFKDTPDTWIKETSIFRSNTYSFILLTKGQANYKIGLSEYDISDNSLYFMAPRHIRYYNRLSKWEGFVVVFMDSFFVDNPVLKKLVQSFEGFKSTSKVVIHLNQKEVDVTKNILQLLHDISYSNTSLKFDKAKAILELLMIQSTELYTKYYQDVDIKLSKPHRILKSFDQIIEEHLYDITQDNVDRILTIKEIANLININPFTPIHFL